MIDHVGVNVPDLREARPYYDELMPMVGFEPFVSDDRKFSYRPAGGKPGTALFFYGAVEDAQYSRRRAGLQHLAFFVRSRDTVDAVHRWALGRQAEIIRPAAVYAQYHPNYYAVFWRSPEGFMLEAVCHKPG